MELSHWWFVGRREIMRRLVARVTPPGSAVVDVGCGTGANIAALAGTYRAIGVDTSADAIGHARARFPSTKFLEGDAKTALPGIHAPIGCVLIMDVLEHVKDDFNLFASVLAPLAAGSHVLVTVPADMRLWSPHDISFQHYRRYDTARLSAIWAHQPVKVRLLSPFCAGLYWPIRIVRAVRRRLERGRGAPQSDLNVPLLGLNGPLGRAFAAEAVQLEHAIDTGAAPFSHGSSLIAVLERQDGSVSNGGKPAQFAADPHEPWPAQPA